MPGRLERHDISNQPENRDPVGTFIHLAVFFGASVDIDCKLFRNRSNINIKSATKVSKDGGDKQQVMSAWECVTVT